MKTIERLKQYIDYKQISLNAFDEKIGVGNGYIGKQIKNSASIGSDILEKIFSKFKDLNPIWLITGTGKMLRENLDQKSRFNSQNESCQICAEKERLIKVQAESIKLNTESIVSIEKALLEALSQNSILLNEIKGNLHAPSKRRTA